MGKKLAIKGHATRGKEVIELLEMMGGKDAHLWLCIDSDRIYYISDGYVHWDYIGPEEIEKYKIFTLEDFLKKFPYKVGDKVHIYVQTDDFDGMCDVKVTEITSMRWNPVMCEIAYKMKNINREFYKEEIKCKVDDDSNKTTKDMEEDKIDLTLKGESYHGNRISYQIPDSYEVSKIENGEIILQKKKSKHPTTYEECCEVFGLNHYLDISWNSYDEYSGVITCLPKQIYDIAKKLKSLSKLLICRNAYWKIYGEKMGLDRPWDSVYGCGEWGYWIGYDINTNKIYCQNSRILFNHLLVFPTEEMRDAFYDNFKEEIEECKELL